MRKPCRDCNTMFDDGGKAYKDRCIGCYIKDKKANPNPFSKNPAALIPKEWNEFIKELPSLIQLCHPDRHDQSKGSLRISDWLLEVRRKHAPKGKDTLRNKQGGRR